LNNKLRFHLLRNPIC